MRHPFTQTSQARCQIQDNSANRLRPWVRCAVLLAITVIYLATICGGLNWHFNPKRTFAQAGVNPPFQPQGAKANFAPYLEIVPSQDGSELYIQVSGVSQREDALFANVGIGPTGDKRSYTMRYSETLESFVATAIGLTPGEDAAGRLDITTTLGLNTSNVDFRRAFVPASTRQTLQSADGNLELSLVNTDTITFDTYAVVVPSYAPPGALPPGHHLIGSVYSVRAAGALVQTERPMNLRLYYDEQLLAGADPHMLAIFAWDAASRRWLPLQGRLFIAQRYVTVATPRFTTYALLATPAWRDDFDDFDGLAVDTLDNITLGGTPANRALVLANAPGTGSVLSVPISPTTGIAAWGVLTFSGTLAAPTTTLTVDVLSVDGLPLLTNVASGSDLAAIDPIQHPVLRLRANLAATTAGQTPALEAWQLTWRTTAATGQHQVYLPVINAGE